MALKMTSDRAIEILVEVVQGVTLRESDTEEEALYRADLVDEVEAAKAAGDIIEIPFEMPD